ncbi:hypothetical protein [Streptomyces wuyuanensis]|uniref:hypothetical protein n=1 Tax=Streptomyces wuyuanensis TaxID=1196353 RepID=UPI003449BA56
MTQQNAVECPVIAAAVAMPSKPGIARRPALAGHHAGGNAEPVGNILHHQGSE